MEKKTYINGVSVKKIEMKNGGSLMKLGINRKKLIEHLLSLDVNEKGYLNLCIASRKEVDDWGNTHTCFLDTWKPDPTKARSREQGEIPAASTRPVASDEDIPF